MSEGKHAYHQGVAYEEHHGTEIKLLFGQEMVYIIGSEHKSIIGMESKINFGAIADVGLATQVKLEFGAEVQWHASWPLVLAAHGGGVFDGAFAVSAGSTKIGSFKSLKGWLMLVVVAQVLAAGGSAALVKTVLAPHTNADGEVSISGNSGFFWIATVNAQLLSLATVILTFVLSKLIEKQSNLDPLAAMSINKQSYGFLGVRSFSNTAGSAGSSGLALSPQAFTLSFDETQRDFDRHGHEITAFKTEGSSSIKGDPTGITMKSKSVSIKTGEGANKAELQLKPDSSSSLSHSTDTTSSSLILKTKESETAVLEDKNKGTVSVAPEEVTIKLSKNKAAPALAANWEAICSLQMGADKVKLSFLESSANVSLSKESASLSLGAVSIEINSAGISIGGTDDIKILKPNVLVKDLPTILKLAKAEAASELETAKNNTKNELIALENALRTETANTFARSLRVAQAKVDHALLKLGELK